MIRLAIAGAAGRMGQCVLNLASRSQDIEVVCGLVAPGSSAIGSTVCVGAKTFPLSDQLKAECDVLVDVSVPAGTISWVDYCERRDIPMVIGVTGHSDAQRTRIQEAAHQIPVVFAANFSVGLTAALEILQPLIQRLGDGFDVEIVETHHRNKMDAPSGTALAIAEEIRRASQPQTDQQARFVFGRQGKTGPRSSAEIGIHAVRMGDVVGQHEIYLSGPGETVTIRHTAHSRDAFAAGALRAAQWVVGQGAGLYSMHDVLAPTPIPEPGTREPDLGF